MSSFQPRGRHEGRQHGRDLLFCTTHYCKASYSCSNLIIRSELFFHGNGVQQRGEAFFCQIWLVMIMTCAEGERARETRCDLLCHNVTVFFGFPSYVLSHERITVDAVNPIWNVSVRVVFVLLHLSDHEQIWTFGTTTTTKHKKRMHLQNSTSDLQATCSILTHSPFAKRKMIIHYIIKHISPSFNGRNPNA